MDFHTYDVEQNRNRKALFLYFLNLWNSNVFNESSHPSWEVPF